MVGSIAHCDVTQLDNYCFRLVECSPQRACSTDLHRDLETQIDMTALLQVARAVADRDLRALSDL